MTDEVGLRDYIDAMFAEKEKALQAALASQKEAVAAALDAADKAVTKAEANAEKWRENANEWRGAMSDRDRELPSRREVETLVAGVAARVSVLEGWRARFSGKAEGIGVSASVLVGSLSALGVVVAVVVVVANLLTG